MDHIAGLGGFARGCFGEVVRVAVVACLFFQNLCHSTSRISQWPYEYWRTERSNINNTIHTECYPLNHLKHVPFQSETNWLRRYFHLWTQDWIVVFSAVLAKYFRVGGREMHKENPGMNNPSVAQVSNSQIRVDHWFNDFLCVPNNPLLTMNNRPYQQAIGQPSNNLYDPITTNRS